MIFYFFANLVDVFLTVPTGVDESITRAQIIPVISNSIRSPYFLPYLFVFCLGLAIYSVFFLGVQTRLYINLKKRRF